MNIKPTSVHVQSYYIYIKYVNRLRLYSIFITLIYLYITDFGLIDIMFIKPTSVCVEKLLSIETMIFKQTSVDDKRFNICI